MEYTWESPQWRMRKWSIYLHPPLLIDWDDANISVMLSCAHFLVVFACGQRSWTKFSGREDTRHNLLRWDKSIPWKLFSPAVSGYFTRAEGLQGKVNFWHDSVHLSLQPLCNVYYESCPKLVIGNRKNDKTPSLLHEAFWCSGECRQKDNLNIIRYVQWYGVFLH